MHIRNNVTKLRKMASTALMLLAALAVVIGVFLNAGMTVQASSPVEVGYRDFKFPNGTGSNDSPTGEKPESKLWWNDGHWWASMWSTAGSSYHIFRLDWNTQDWTDTGVKIDDRAKSRADTLWDGNKLYVVSHIFTTSATSATAGNRGELYRYSYNPNQKTYSLDAGFPVEVNQALSESLVLEKDSSGQLWVTWVQNQQVMVNHSLNGNDLQWGTPFALPVGSASQVTADDISSIITYNQHVGIMWSNQKTPKTMYYAVHPVGAPDSVWTQVRAYTVSSDDHINLKSLEADTRGNVFAVVKTSKSTGTIVLLVCKANLNRCKSDTDWQSYNVYDSAYSPTRAILLLDTSNRNLYVFAQVRQQNSARGIYYKRTSLDKIQFTSADIGTPFISSSSDTQVNDPTSTKQNLNSETGLVVLASDSGSNYYLHNYIDLGGAPVPPTATSTPTSTSTSTVPPPGPTSTFTPTPTSTQTSLPPDPGATFTPTPTQTSTPSPSPTATATSTATPTQVVNPGQGTTIRDITFENGALVDAVNGADKVVGSVVLDSGSAVKGTYSARIPNAGSSYLEVNFAGVDDLYASFYIKLNALPSADTRILFISNGGATVGNIYLLKSGAVRLRDGSTSLGNTEPLALNTQYRVGIRQKAGSGSNAVLEAYLAEGDVPFGAPFALRDTGAWATQADRIRIGATLSSTVDFFLDDIRLAENGMPGPSAP